MHPLGEYQSTLSANMLVNQVLRCTNHTRSIVGEEDCMTRQNMVAGETIGCLSGPETLNMGWLFVVHSPKLPKVSPPPPPPDSNCLLLCLDFFFTWDPNFSLIKIYCSVNTVQGEALHKCCLFYFYLLVYVSYMKYSINVSFWPL